MGASTEYIIQGITSTGKTFRPSDWSERLAGAMSCFGPAPGGRSGPNAYMKYSLYVRPVIIGSTKCVVLDSRLRDIEPMAFEFVLSFARDNDLTVSEGCSLDMRDIVRPRPVSTEPEPAPKERAPTTAEIIGLGRTAQG